MSSFLEINGTNFVYNNHEVFLSGVNQPWVSFGADFGNNQPNAIFCELNYTLINLTEYHGNSIRIWLHTNGFYTPQFDSNGFVIGTDAANTLINDFKLYLDAAAQHNILIFPVLWAGPSLNNKNSYNLWGLFNSTDKLQSYIDNALIPMIKAWSNHPALGGIEIINEPEGNLLIAHNNEECFDTTRLQGTGAGWNNVEIPMKTILNFIGLQTSAIHQYCDRCLVHVGSWNIVASTDSFGYFNYYKDECIIKAMNESNYVNKYTGNVTLDFQSIHNYGPYKSSDPVFNPSNVYNINKPVLIGEFASNSGNLSIEYIYNFFYENNYTGAWDWASITPLCNGTLDCMSIMDKGMNNLYQQFGKNNNNIDINIEWNVNVSARCWCSDQISGDYTCQQQAIWLKCNETWMEGNCCQSCHSCIGCT